MKLVMSGRAHLRSQFRWRARRGHAGRDPLEPGRREAYLGTSTNEERPSARSARRRRSLRVD